MIKTREKIYGRDCFERVYFAHRGLHDRQNGIPENSMGAFRAAVSKGYGVELDVQLSRDGQIVVFHDDTLDRMCGVNGRVDEYTYEELHNMSLLGTEYTICLFSDILDVLAEGSGPLLCELKTGKNNKELCEKTYRLLRSYPGKYCIESFNPFIVKWFLKNAPEVFRGQLAGPAKGYPKSVTKMGAWLLATCRLSFINKPDFIAYEIGRRPKRVLKKRAKGLMIFGWTSRDPDDAVATGESFTVDDALIFENYRPELSF